MRALLPSTFPETDISKADMPPRKRACFTAPTLGFEIGESSAAGAGRQPGPTESDLRRCRVEQAGYGITDTDRPDHHRDGDDEPFDDDDDDTDDEDQEKEPFEEDDEEEEHSASVDSSAVPIGDLVLSAGEIEALEADEPTHAPGSPI
nr:hypothetical protein [Tanacetum cinerariifolium]